jgi:hypothetical protein
MKTFLALIIAFTQIGCATLIQPGPDHVKVTSIPDGADVYLNGIPVGKTPMMLSLRRNDDAHIELKKEGYPPLVVDRHKVLSGWFLGNLLIGGLIGMGVDVASGNVSKHSDKPIQVNLSSGRTPASN